MVSAPDKQHPRTPSLSKIGTFENPLVVAIRTLNNEQVGHVITRTINLRLRISVEYLLANRGPGRRAHEAILKGVVDCTARLTMGLTAQVRRHF